MASYGETHFNLVGFLIQATAIAIEATRVTLIQILLQSSGGMSPLKSLYCKFSSHDLLFDRQLNWPTFNLTVFAPICLATNAVLIIPFEGLEALQALPQLGLFTILSNATLTFLLNLSTIYLIDLSSMVLSLTKVV